MTPLPPPSLLEHTAQALRAGIRLTLLVLLATACAGPKADPRTSVSVQNQDLVRGALAAVEIQGQSLATVMDTTESVFTEGGFTVASRKPDQRTFERPAGRSEVAAYGNWQGMEVRIRLRVDYYEQSSGRILAICRSFVAREAGTMAEDEQPLRRRRVREYEPLLHEVANRLN